MVSRLSSYRNWSKVERLAALLCGVLVTACTGEQLTEPTGTGFLQVVVEVQGPDADMAVRATLDDGPSLIVAGGGSEAFSDVPAGSHEVALSEVAPNCQVEPANPLAVTVAADETAKAVFTLVCARLEGTLRVEASTTGQAIDPDGYTITVDGVDGGRVGAEGAVEFTVGAGGHEVVLGDLAENCRPVDTRQRSVVVAANETAIASVAIVCAGPLQPGQLLVTSARGHRAEIYRMEADGSNPIRLTENAWGSAGASASPDRSEIVFHRFDGSDWGIHVMDGDGSNVRVLTTGQVSGPSWSPDGSRILFTRGTEIWTMNADGSSQGRVREAPCIDVEPAWSPSGDRIAFSSCEPGGDFSIWIMNADGTGAQQVTTVGDNRHPTWSPDESRIAYWSFRDGIEEVLVINTDGTGEVSVAPGRDPAWSPDGAKITLVGPIATAGGLLYRVSPDGTDLELIDDAGRNSDPAWVP